MDRTTELLSIYACELTYDHLPLDVVHHVKRTLIDTVGCALGGFPAEPSRIARQLAQCITCTKPSRVLGTDHCSSPDMASFANGCMIRYLDYNDSYASNSGGHPSDMIAAVLAVSEATSCDGRTIIAAIVLAYEVFCRLSDQIDIGELGWDHGMVSVVGAVCGVGKVLGLDLTAMGHAISLAAVSNLPLGVTRIGELSMWKGCAAANASRAAVFAAQLAQLGMVGPEAPFEGRDGLWQQAVGRPVHIEPFDNNATGYRIMSNIFKFYPAQTHTQGPIGLALELRSKLPISDIASIRIRTYAKATSSAAAESEKWAPQSRETADHSIPYLVAYAFQYGAVTSHSFSDNYLHDPAIQALIGKISVEEDSDFTRRFSDEYNCHMELTNESGHLLTAAVAHPKGFPGNVLSDKELEDKFRNLVTDLLSAEQCNRALSILWSLEEAPNLTALHDSIVVAS